jgi:hypothetical protein
MAVIAYPEVVAALSEWSGCWAEPWSYTTSHDIFRLKLGWRDRSECAVLFMKACHRVAFDDSWDGFAPSVEEYEGPHGRRFRVTDSDHLDVDCGNVYLSRRLDSYAEIPFDPTAQP